ncbi:DUF221-domain-containing protein [Trichodelitschia bisporula]|uniref:DUF221-domain-containing protein n=1 Tax=Trichodelitschia bisporula TaxID=703511 RepID=A0A6G1HL44_9PEZI|nr:DUF221-domain-containing protein [Trichodelitschia bisporula]
MTLLTPSVMLDGAAKMLIKRVNEKDDSNIGSAVNQPKSNSASSLLSTLTPVAVIAIIWLAVFICIRPKASWKYAPRTRSKLLRESDYTPPLKAGLFNWLPQLFSISDTFVLNHQSLDGYLFLRFLRISVIICLVGCAITWPVLFPINITGGGGNQQLDKLNFGNVVNPWKYFAHAGCAWLFFGFVMIMITRESVFYINLRQAYLMSPNYARKLSSRTVLFTAVPDEYLNEAKLREMLGSHVKRVWFPTDTKELDDLVKERNKIAYGLEGAETKLIRLANAARLKAEGGAVHDEATTAHPKSHAEAATDGINSGEIEAAHEGAARWVRPKDRPTHRLKFLIGKKVDTIEWSRAELNKMIPEVEHEQDKHRRGEARKLRAVFVEFINIREAQAAFQSLTHHQIITMAPRFTGVHPLDVIWSNLRIRGWERMLRKVATLSFVVGLVIFWSIPVAFVGAISNINYLTDKLPWLDFINKIPTAILGVVTGLLPVVLLAVLMALLPIILRLAARLGGAPTHSDVEYTVQNYYFAFQVVQVFLVATVASAASSAVSQIIKNPTSVTSLLSKQIPKASNFYLSYFVLQGLGVFAGMLVGVAGLIVTPLLAKILGSTPRKLFMRWNQLSGLGWGTVYPVYTNLLVIAMCYACIAPLVLIFAAIGLYLFYFAYRYNLLYVYSTGVDTRGLVYPRALQQLFVGMYIAEICLLGLFATRLDKKGTIGPFVMMILLVIFTALYNVGLNSAITPLLRYLPKTLEDEERSALLESDAPGETLEDQPPPRKKPGIVAKFLKPHVYCDYATMRRLVPALVTESDDVDEGLVRDAYLPPSVWTDTPRLVVPRDEGGVSAREVADSTSQVKGLWMSDEGATLDPKNKMVVNDDFMSKLYWEDKTRLMAESH